MPKFNSRTGLVSSRSICPTCPPGTPSWIGKSSKIKVEGYKKPRWEEKTTKRLKKEEGEKKHRIRYITSYGQPSLEPEILTRPVPEEIPLEQYYYRDVVEVKTPSVKYINGEVFNLEEFNALPIQELLNKLTVWGGSNGWKYAADLLEIDPIRYRSIISDNMGTKKITGNSTDIIKKSNNMENQYREYLDKYGNVINNIPRDSMTSAKRWEGPIALRDNGGNIPAPPPSRSYSEILKDKWDNFVAHLNPNYKYNGGHNGGINYYTMIPRWFFFTPLAKKQDIETKKLLEDLKPQEPPQELPQDELGGKLNYLDFFN